MAVNNLKENQYYNVVRDYQKESSKLQKTLNNTSKTSTENNVFENIAKSYNINNGIAKDGLNDGKISFGDKLKNFGKGVWNGLKGMVKGAIQHPIKTALMIGACCIPGVGPFIAGGLAAYGIAKGTVGIVKSAKAAHNATTDAEAEAAWQGIGTGSFQVGISALAMKGAVKTIKANNAALAEAGTSAIKSTKLFGKDGQIVGSLKNGKATFENSAIGKTVIESSAGKVAKSAKDAFSKAKGLDKVKAETYKDVLNETNFSKAYEAARLNGKGRFESLYEGSKGTLEGYKGRLDVLRETAELKVAKYKADKIDQNGALTDAELKTLLEAQMREHAQSTASKALETKWHTVKTNVQPKNLLHNKTLRTPVYAVLGATEEDQVQYVY